MSRPPLTDINDTPGLIGLGNLPSQAPVAAFNPDLTNSLLNTKSFAALHYRHAPSPDRHSLAEGLNLNTSSATGTAVIYYSVRTLGIVPQSFKLEDRLTVQGVFNTGSVIINVTGHYWDGDQGAVFVRPRDLIVMPSLTAMTSQLIEFNPTGPQRLHYKARGVDLLMDGDGTIYKEGLDFTINDGMLVWVNEPTAQRPKMVNGRGDILTVVYYYTPIYIVENIPHQLRVLPANHAGSGAMPREATYFPQLLIAKPSTAVEPDQLAAFYDLPPYPAWPNTPNVTGGSV
jgi:hypothetical protein